MVRHTVLAPDWQSAHELVKAIEARGGFARKVTRFVPSYAHGLHIVLSYAPRKAFQAACRAVQFRPGLSEGYNAGRAL